MTPEEFPALFAEGWALPKPGPFLDYFLPLIDDQATFTQPMFPVARGPAEIEHMFRRLFALLPDLTAEPRQHAVHAHTVYVESDCRATLGTKSVNFSVCDRFVIENGKILDRLSYSDPTAMILAILRRPRSWRRAVSSRIGSTRPVITARP